MTATLTCRIAGIEESRGERCECCGTYCPRKRIVLSDGEAEIRVGSTCAARILIGDDSAKSVKLVTDRATAVSAARRWLSAGETPHYVAVRLGTQFGLRASWRTGGVSIDGVGVVGV